MKDLLTGDMALQGIYHPMGADNPARIDELERLTGYTLPADYREFLLHFAPSMFVRNVCFRPLEARPGGYPYEKAQAFFGLDENNIYDVIGNYNNTNDQYPAGMIPIAFDGGANRILLALDAPAGRIYYQSKFHGNKLYLCANTFTGFLNSCVIVDDGSEDEDEVDEVIENSGSP